MPTMQAETWWIQEFQPPALADLCQALRDYFGVGPAYIGSKGDTNHTYGYHRSRAWILNSAYSDYGSADYSVQAAADLEGDDDWLCAVDFNPGSVDKLIEVCQRLDAAVRAGLCPQLREWYGNVDGDQVVDGWDLLRDRAATSDSSHLWHLHMSVLRGRAGDDHSNLYAILTGEDDMTPQEMLAARITGVKDGVQWDFSFGDFTVGTNEAAWTTLNEMRAANAADEIRDKAVLAAVTALATAGGVDSAPIVAAVQLVRDEARAEYQRLHTELAAAQREALAAKTEVQQLQVALAAAAQAQADALKADG